MSTSELGAPFLWEWHFLYPSLCVFADLSAETTPILTMDQWYWRLRDLRCWHQLPILSNTSRARAPPCPRTRAYSPLLQSLAQHHRPASLQGRRHQRPNLAAVCVHNGYGRWWRSTDNTSTPTTFRPVLSNCTADSVVISTAGIIFLFVVVLVV